ncbi:aminotransferase class I/II-fold pyridoxal phosphate-dependent enzyme [Acuticoccus mangrovi]|uniref:Aminotransferase class I/II-fold pyridoxal phosphate-dependent enzyme n=1 Tax=Acuticoccus mangrovi TaxID=2796142 RepID=A0A934IK56_9HYPH|nr:aminotransferase class I/II-fold pyridoxal phosphate-dependent enzyme [Acuticoccus mangrovi]MBJ3778159.1 aminotransferase class I/II-fold pyridoxal phosphate-dependent enzyme [Acuticoccus mangrovi]
MTATNPLSGSERALGGVTTDFVADSPDLLARWDEHQAWWDERLQHRVDPFARTTLGPISTECETRTRDGATYAGVNFASQDYLNLASHDAVRAAAKATIDRFGVHSAGSAALMGNTSASVLLESALANFLGYRDCIVFPTGWGAGYGTVKTLVRPTDHIVIDVLAHACLQEGAHNATRNVHTFPHLSNAAVERRLRRLRQADTEAGILVVTESVFSMDSDVPDLAELQAICTKYGATLLVDVAHDLGAIGAAGGGYLERQGMVGSVDLVMGSFSKTFASNGGFVATNQPALRRALLCRCGPLMFTNAISPVQATIVSTALDIIRSSEGAELRERLMRNILYMRKRLEEESFEVMGAPSAIVPVLLGTSRFARLITRFALEGGALVNSVEYPGVSRNSCRWRIQMMANHTIDQIERFIDIAKNARERVERDDVLEPT